MERSGANSDKGSKADSSKESTSRIRPEGENERKMEHDPLRGLVPGRGCRGCGTTLESIAQGVTALPGAQRREAAMALQRSRGNRFVQEMAAQAKREPNRTGMPDRLKAGIESLSGIDISDVRVHANSDRPARLNALAYTQGNQIYLGPEQERHLPHEAWHAVQQKQGRVRATRQLKDRANINNHVCLENEAERMAKQLSLERHPEKSIDLAGQLQTQGQDTSIWGGVIQCYCGHPACQDPDCQDRSNHPPTLQQVMETIDPIQEIHHAMQTADARYQFQARQNPGGAHLHQSREVRGTERRLAQITSPGDRLYMSAEDRSQGEVHYALLSQAPRLGLDPLVSGRLQDPVNDNLPRERYIYEQGMQGPPSYPREGDHFTGMAATQNMTNQQVFSEIVNAMLVNPLGTQSDESQQRHLITTANIIGIAEQRRDPYMSFASAQTLDYASAPGSSLTPREVFGRRKGRINQPGHLPASGTGAVQHFREFRSDIVGGQPPTSASSQQLFRNIEQQHLDLMRQGFDPQAAQRLHEEGDDEEFIVQCQQARMRSAATRRAARLTGQLRYDLRDLRYWPY